MHIDDLAIEDDEQLVRGISGNLPSYPIVTDPKEDKGWRFSSVIFSYHWKDKCISVYINSEITQADLDMQITNEGYQGFVSVIAGYVRKLEHGIERKKLAGQDYHANIFDTFEDRTGHQKKRILEKLAKSAQWKYNPKNI